MSNAKIKKWRFKITET